MMRLAGCVVLLFTGEAASGKATGVAMSIHSSSRNREQAGIPRGLHVGSNSVLASQRQECADVLSTNDDDSVWMWNRCTA